MTSKGLFWKLAVKDSPQRYSVLFGTIHLSIDSQDLRDKIVRWIDEFDHVYTETSLNADGQALIAPHVSVTRTKWDEYFNHNQQKRIAQILKRAYQIDFAQVKHLRPMFIMSMIYSHLGDMNSGDKLDQFIWNYASQEGRATYGIESIHRQVEILKSIPIELDFIQFRRWTRNVTKMNHYFKKMLSLYHSENIHQLSKLSAKQMPSIKSLLITERNEQMTRTIIEEHQKHPGFFSFGAGHLGGRNGVLSILKRNGFIIERI